MVAVALSIAGSDSSGGAGVVADLKTFEAFGVWGAVALTAVTAQNTLGIQTFEVLTPELVRAQIASVMSDLTVGAAKTGMLGSAEVGEAVSTTVAELGLASLVVDPVLSSSHGQALTGPGRAAREDLLDVIRGSLLPLATVVTPNLDEAEALTGLPVRDRQGMVAAAEYLVERGAGAVLVKGGHLEGELSPDCLLVGGAEPQWFEGPRLGSRHTHGTGCVLSAAICAGLTLGTDVESACRTAKDFVSGALAGGRALGAGTGAVDPGRCR